MMAVDMTGRPGFGAGAASSGMAGLVRRAMPINDPNAISQLLGGNRVAASFMPQSATPSSFAPHSAAPSSCMLLPAYGMDRESLPQAAPARPMLQQSFTAELECMFGGDKTLTSSITTELDALRRNAPISQMTLERVDSLLTADLERNLGSMSMDELILWVQGGQRAAAAASSVAATSVAAASTGGYMASTSTAAPKPLSRAPPVPALPQPATQLQVVDTTRPLQPLVKQSSLPRELGRKTVEEVWRDIQAKYDQVGQPQPAEAPPKNTNTRLQSRLSSLTFGDITFEEFLNTATNLEPWNSAILTAPLPVPAVLSAADAVAAPTAPAQPVASALALPAMQQVASEQVQQPTAPPAEHIRRSKRQKLEVAVKPVETEVAPAAGNKPQSPLKPKIETPATPNPMKFTLPPIPPPPSARAAFPNYNKPSPSTPPEPAKRGRKRGSQKRTPEEIEQQALLRRVKCRESAERSRARKQQMRMELEQEVSILRSEVNRLHQEVTEQAVGKRGKLRRTRTAPC
eukprot:jgi/Chlat1/4966/Chrsp32S04950